MFLCKLKKMSPDIIRSQALHQARIEKQVRFRWVNKPFVYEIANFPLKKPSFFVHRCSCAVSRIKTLRTLKTQNAADEMTSTETMTSK